MATQILLPLLEGRERGTVLQLWSVDL